MINCDDIKTPDQWHEAMRALAKHGAKIFDDSEKADPKAGKAKQALTPDKKTDEQELEEKDESSGSEPDDDYDD